MNERAKSDVFSSVFDLVEHAFDRMAVARNTVGKQRVREVANRMESSLSYTALVCSANHDVTLDLKANSRECTHEFTGAYMKKSAPLALLLALFPATVWAGLPTGLEIATKAHDSQEGYEGQRFSSIMELYDPKGKLVVKYKMMQFAVEGTKANGEETKSLIRFLAPAASKGTALLTHEKKGEDENRWLYLADTRQVKRIGGGSKSASFKGSELAYEDMNSDTLDKYTYKTLGEEKVNGRKTWKVESKPKFSGSGYSKIVSWYDQENNYVIKANFYDKAGAKLKESTTKGWKKFQGKWRAQWSQVKNVQTGRKTIVKNGKFKLNIKLSPKMFTVSQLQKS